ncbi:MAG: lipopolysaccharide heptosyltransferase I [Pseudolabrys sp.]|nr:lipopolysaccharide heptosyltransferase I [Pseudolabrys sp.]MDP2298020.1 lipopolysaccharide heptosyltransferase I [Pseudolabrys sp.]
MPDILFIKTSSLGDVVHHMPALTEARAARPGARLAWLVEEAFAPLARLHPGIDVVVPVAWRRWRKSLLSPAVWGEIARSLRAMRAVDYDLVIDTQGLLRTGMLSRIAHGTRHGYDRDSIREPLASVFYDVRHKVSRDLHAVERNRILCGLALGYAPEGAPDFGLDRARFRAGDAPYAVLLHATAQARKEWPVDNWIALGREIARQGVEIVLPWGTAGERARSELIAASVPGARVPERAPLDQVARRIGGAHYVVGVDTGLLHLAAALGVPLVAIFTGSKPQLTGPVGSGPLTVLGTDGAAPGVDDVIAAVEKLKG